MISLICCPNLNVPLFVKSHGLSHPFLLITVRPIKFTVLMKAFLYLSLFIRVFPDDSSVEEKQKELESLRMAE